MRSSVQTCLYPYVRRAMNSLIQVFEGLTQHVGNRLILDTTEGIQINPWKGYGKRFFITLKVKFLVLYITKHFTNITYSQL
jgi:hypothetical protein